MKRSIITTIVVSGIALIFACKEPFNQVGVDKVTNYLIVDGVINTAGPTSISLSRTLTMSDKLALKPELKAAVQVEGETSGVFPLAEKTSGLYSVDQLNLNAVQKYRLRIRTSAGKIYLSDYVAIKNTPAIDSISWDRTKDGVEIYANAHDSKNETRYYQWEYEEDWELRSRLPSVYKVNLITPSGPKPPFLNLDSRPLAEVNLLYTCYRNTKSSVLSIFSTVNLTNDIVHKFPIQLIANGSDKLEQKYSILVKQRALSRQAYEYLSLMQKNSERGGSLFDVQPTEIKGNIHNSADPNEMVIGFVEAVPVIEKRIFILPSQVPTWKVNLNCVVQNVPNQADSLAVWFDPNDRGAMVPTDATEVDVTGPTLRVIRVDGMTAGCVNCRVRGGSNIKPSFW